MKKEFILPNKDGNGPRKRSPRTTGKGLGNCSNKKNKNYCNNQRNRNRGK